MSYGKWFHPIDCEPGVGISGVDTGRPYFTWVLYVTENILSTNTINKFLSRKFPLNPFIFICMHYRALVSVACTCGHQRAPCVHLRALACTSVHLACSRVHLACSGARVTFTWHVPCLESIYIIMRHFLGKFKVYVIYLRNQNPSHAHIQPPRGMLRPIRLARAYGLKNK